MDKKLIHTVRNILVIISTVLMIAVVVFQCLEINEYGIWQHIQDTITKQFQPEPAAAPAAPAAPAPAE